ncbi:MAG: peptidoglycan-binding protein [Candidatus Competibacterales bacterium]
MTQVNRTENESQTLEAPERAAAVAPADGNADQFHQALEGEQGPAVTPQSRANIMISGSQGMFGLDEGHLGEQLAKATQADLATGDLAGVAGLTAEVLDGVHAEEGFWGGDDSSRVALATARHLDDDQLAALAAHGDGVGLLDTLAEHMEDNGVGRQERRQLARIDRALGQGAVAATANAAPAFDLNRDFANAPPGEVRALQTHLEEAGYEPGPIDGLWGGQTRAALEKARADRSPGQADLPTSAEAQVGAHGDAMVVVYPDYPISIPDGMEAAQWLLGNEANLGHADVVSWSDAEGGQVRPMLHQFGRYDGDANAQGIVREHQLDITLDIDPKTKDLTPESRDALLTHLSDNFGHGGRIKAAEVEEIDLDRFNAFTSAQLAQNDNPNREAYDVLSHNCTTFAWDAAAAGAFDEDVADNLAGRGAYRLPGHSFMGVSRVADYYEYTPAQ